MLSAFSNTPFWSLPLLFPPNFLSLICFLSFKAHSNCHSVFHFPVAPCGFGKSVCWKYWWFIRTSTAFVKQKEFESSTLGLISSSLIVQIILITIYCINLQFGPFSNKIKKGGCVVFNISFEELTAATRVKMGQMQVILKSLKEKQKPDVIERKLTRFCFMGVFEGEYVREYTCSCFILDNILYDSFIFSRVFKINQQIYIICS